MRASWRVLLALILALLLPAGATLAQSGGGYELAWCTVDGGGGLSSGGGGYALRGTVGQPDAGTARGGSYALAGGFWDGAVPPGHAVFLPLVLRD